MEEDDALELAGRIDRDIEEVFQQLPEYLGGTVVQRSIPHPGENGQFVNVHFFISHDCNLNPVPIRYTAAEILDRFAQMTAIFTETLTTYMPGIYSIWDGTVGFSYMLNDTADSTSQEAEPRRTVSSNPVEGYPGCNLFDHVLLSWTPQHNKLEEDRWLLSESGNHMLKMEAQCTLVLYVVHSGEVVWMQMGEEDVSCYLLLQDDGVILLIHDDGSSSQVMWRPWTTPCLYCNKGAFLVVQEDCNIVSYEVPDHLSDGVGGDALQPRALWASNTVGECF